MFIEKKRRAPVYISRNWRRTVGQVGFGPRLLNNIIFIYLFFNFNKTIAASPINTVFQNCLLFNDAILKQAAKHPNHLCVFCGLKNKNGHL
jgi:hypothetical protein